MWQSELFNWPGGCWCSQHAEYYCDWHNWHDDTCLRTRVFSAPVTRVSHPEHSPALAPVMIRVLGQYHCRVHRHGTQGCVFMFWITANPSLSITQARGGTMGSGPRRIPALSGPALHPAWLPIIQILEPFINKAHKGAGMRALLPTLPGINFGFEKRLQELGASQDPVLRPEVQEENGNSFRVKLKTYLDKLATCFKTCVGT